MAYQLSTAARNALLDAIETAVGTAPLLKLYAGPPPANCAASETGLLLSSITLPTDWMAAAASGSKAMLGTWDQPSAAATGKPGHFRIYDSTGTTCHWQGYACGPWVASTAYAVGDLVLNGGNVYQCTTAGTSAASGGPSGTGTGIADGGAVWSYEQAGADMSLNSGLLNSGQDFSVTSFSITAGAA